MLKRFLALAAFLASTAAFAYSASGTLHEPICDDDGTYISVTGTCAISSSCSVSWSSGDSLFGIDYVYLWETTANNQPLEPSGAVALPLNSCTENGGPNNLPGYNCDRMKAHGTGSSGSGSCQSGGCAHSWYETTADNENLFYHGVRLTAQSYADFPDGTIGSFTWVFDQTATNYDVAEVHYHCQVGSVVWSWQKDFLIHVTP